MLLLYYHNILNLIGGGTMSFESIKKITLDDMMEYIDKNEPTWRNQFVEYAYQKQDGTPSAKYNHLNATRRFCEKFMPELIPVAKEKPIPASDKLKAWAAKK